MINAGTILETIGWKKKKTFWDFQLFSQKHKSKGLAWPV
jgi:hypothetical protein